MIHQWNLYCLFSSATGLFVNNYTACEISSRACLQADYCNVGSYPLAPHPLVILVITAFIQALYFRLIASAVSLGVCSMLAPPHWRDVRALAVPVLEYNIYTGRILVTHGGEHFGQGRPGGGGVAENCYSNCFVRFENGRVSISTG